MKKYLLSLLLITSLTAAASHDAMADEGMSDEDEGTRVARGEAASSDMLLEEDGEAAAARKAPATDVTEIRSSLGTLRISSDGSILSFQEHKGGRTHRPAGGKIILKEKQTFSGIRLAKQLTLQGSPTKLRSVLSAYPFEDD